MEIGLNLEFIRSSDERHGARCAHDVPRRGLSDHSRGFPKAQETPTPSR